MAKTGQISRFKIDADKTIDIKTPDSSSVKRDVIEKGLD
jgi:hypothetical protein